MNQSTHGDITLSPQEAAQALVTCYKAHQPVILWGPPGIGKSDLVRQLAASQGVTLTPVFSTARASPPTTRSSYTPAEAEGPTSDRPSPRSTPTKSPPPR